MKKLILITTMFAQFAGAVIDPQEKPVTKENLLSSIRQEGVTNIDNLLPALPDSLLINFVLKHGIKIKGPRGHQVEHDVSQSADPELPRVILFDERSGTSLSYNSGDRNRHGDLQTHGQRLDVLTFDHQKKTFALDAITFSQQNSERVIYDNVDQLPKKDRCNSCHGPSQRPIFSMYPDWPTFYGSDNDELLSRSSRLQKEENRNYQAFRSQAGAEHPRYQPLYSEDRLQKFFHRSLKWYPSFPYRPNLSGNIEDPSRSFSYRPGLRMGILYNRLTALQIAEKIKHHRNYNEYKHYFLFNLLQCRWTNTQKRREWTRKVGSVVEGPVKTRSGHLLNYRQNLEIFGLRVNDVDIRFSYNHSGYDVKSNNDQAGNVMEVGYVGNRYFNSYFDGSATFDELLAYQLFRDLQQRREIRFGGLNPRGLVQKYGRRVQRMKLDRLFFEEMDRFSRWIPISYPRSLGSAHHREGYPRRFQTQHMGLCKAIEDKL